MLADMLNSGVNMEVVTPLLTKARKAMNANVIEEVKMMRIKNLGASGGIEGTAEKRTVAPFSTPVRTVRTT